MKKNKGTFTFWSHLLLGMLAVFALPTPNDMPKSALETANNFSELRPFAQPATHITQQQNLVLNAELPVVEQHKTPTFHLLQVDTTKQYINAPIRAGPPQNS